MLRVLRCQARGLRSSSPRSVFDSTKKTKMKGIFKSKIIIKVGELSSNYKMAAIETLKILFNQMLMLKDLNEIKTKKRFYRRPTCNSITETELLAPPERALCSSCAMRIRLR